MAAWVLLFALTALALLASLGVAVRARPEGRAEAWVLATLAFYGIICLPVMTLGYLGSLTRLPLAVGSALTSTVAFVLSQGDRRAAEHARACGDLAKEMIRLPLDALCLAVKARSFALLALSAAALSIVASGLIGYLAPSESWDGFFYHEPMVGYAIQSHGFRVEHLPDNMVVQAINGYPRLCESFALWFVIFTDKTFIEIGNTLAAPALLFSTYRLLRRFSRDRVALAGWSATLLMVPAMLTQLRTSMIDIEIAFFLVTAIDYATRPAMTMRAGLVATACLVILVGAKSPSLVWVPPLMIVGHGRLLWAHRKDGLGRALGLTAAGGVAIAGTAALTFLRNWLAFRDPLWPVTYQNRDLHIDWRGLVPLGGVTPQVSLRDLIAQKYHHPTGGIADIIARDYGYGVPWVLVPLGLAAAAFALSVVVRGRLNEAPDEPAENALLLAALGAVFFKVSPSLTIARFNAQLIVIAMALVVWAASRIRRSARLHEGALTMTMILTLVPLAWNDWLFGVDLRGLGKLVKASAAERSTMHAADFQMPPATAQLRERELGRGELLAYTQETAFPGALWNHAMSNRVEYVRFKNATDLFADLDRMGAKWVVVGDKAASGRALRARADAWEEVGVAVKQDGTVAFRRRP